MKSLRRPSVSTYYIEMFRDNNIHDNCIVIPSVIELLSGVIPLSGSVNLEQDT